MTYNGTAQTPCTATVTGAGGLNQSLTVNYSNNTNAGTATASASFAGDANHASSTDSKTFVIDPTASTTTVTCPSSVTYNGSAHTATYTITGVNGEVGATVGTVDLSNTTHTDAGTYNTDSWSFTGTANYNNIAATTITDTINKATATVVVTPYTVTYDGHAHTATVTSIRSSASSGRIYVPRASAIPLFLAAETP